MAETKVVCGIDLAQASLVACLLKTEPDERTSKEWRTFAMTHSDLGAMKDWLVAAGCRVVGMEATGHARWFERLLAELGFELWIGDPAQIDNPYVDARSNGLVYCHNRMKGQALHAHVKLSKGERSKLAELAADLL